MKTKKIILSILFVLLTFSLIAQSFAGKKIVVVEPSFVNGTEDTAWIPLMVQGLLTTNLQNYSKMDVIDRTNLDKVKAEQKISESAMFDESTALELGKLAAAQYIVAVTIIKKSSTYSFDCKITDAETSKSVGKSYTNPNCSLQDIENGNVVNLASRELLIGLGIPESSLKDLTVTSTQQNSAVKSNVALAKGMAKENVSQNIVEAISYYQQALTADSSMTEATTRLNSLTSAVKTGNLREDAKNDIALRKAWLKTLDDLHLFVCNNIPFVVYDPKIETIDTNYENETIALSFNAIPRENPDALKVINTVLEGFNKVKKREWNINVSDYMNIKFSGVFSIYNQDGERLGTEATDPITVNIDRRSFYSETMPIENIPLDKVTDTLKIEFSHFIMYDKSLNTTYSVRTPFVMTEAEFEKTFGKKGNKR